MSVSEKLSGKYRDRYISIYQHDREREIQWEMDRKTKWEIDNSRKERESCVNDRVNDFVNDISRRVTFGAFSGECWIKAHLHPLLSHTLTHTQKLKDRDRTTHGHTAGSGILRQVFKHYICCIWVEKQVKDSPWFCGSAPCPVQNQQCEAPWIRHTETQPGPLSHSCTTSQCSPSTKRWGTRIQRNVRGQRTEG